MPPPSAPLAQPPVQLDGHELDLRVSRLQVHGPQEEAQGLLQLPLAVALLASGDQREEAHFL